MYAFEKTLKRHRVFRFIVVSDDNYRHLEHDPYVYKLQEKFIKSGISCQIQQKDDFYETLAIF